MRLAASRWQSVIGTWMAVASVSVKTLAIQIGFYCGEAVAGSSFCASSSPRAAGHSFF